jgi:hypothetical protein
MQSGAESSRVRTVSFYRQLIVNSSAGVSQIRKAISSASIDVRREPPPDCFAPRPAHFDCRCTTFCVGHLIHMHSRWLV